MSNLYVIHSFININTVHVIDEGKLMFQVRHDGRRCVLRGLTQNSIHYQINLSIELQVVRGRIQRLNESMQKYAGGN